MNPYKTAKRLRAIATRLEKILLFIEKLLGTTHFRYRHFCRRFDEMRFEINSLRSLANEIRPEDSK